MTSSIQPKPATQERGSAHTQVGTHDSPCFLLRGDTSAIIQTAQFLDRDLDYDDLGGTYPGLHLLLLVELGHTSFVVVLTGRACVSLQ